MSTNNKIVHILTLFCFIFFSIIAYLTYFELYYYDKVEKQYGYLNPRKYKEENDILRGKIYDRSGVTLAESKKTTETKQVRIYPYNNLYSHIIGYNSTAYGKSYLEDSRNNELLNLSKNSTWNDIKRRLTDGKEHIGNNVYLTIDHKLQEVARKALGNDYNGAVVAIEPSTGEILALVSKPDFNPNEKELSVNWQNMQESQDKPFYSRATKGLYPPGSTFKVLTSIAAYENNEDGLVLNDQGSTVIDGKTFRNSSNKINGNTDITKALEQSSNVFFTNLGVNIGARNLYDICSKSMFNKNIDFELSLYKSSVSISNSKTEIASTAMGQGKLKVTPLHLALITSAIANDGIMMQPHLVKKVVSHKGEEIETTSPETLTQVTSKDIADKVTNLMIGVVQNGTGTKAALPGVNIAGKTGTAENEVSGKEHAWFIAFAPAENPQIAVVVLKEYTGQYGGTLCAPVAKAVIKEYLEHN